ncbi:MAG: hypothetical protein ACTHJK_13005 [Sphingomicrobium sp.]
MRLIAAFVVLTLAVPATAGDNPRAQMKQAAPTLRAAMSDPRCSPTRSYVADTGSIYHGQKLAPRKLTELPTGTIYMAVFRHIGTCEAPMTMVEYVTRENRR